MMTKNKWRTLIVTSAVIVVVILYGASQYSSLPQTMVTHWGVDNQPNGWMSKAMVVYGLPLLMLVFHWICLGVTYWAAAQGKGAPRMERVLAWIFPVITVIMYVTTIRYAQGQSVNIRLWAIAICSALFVLIGNYLPTVPTSSVRKGWTGFGFHAPWPISNPAGAAKALRALGYTMVAGGALMLISLFFTPVVSVVALVLAIAAILAVMACTYFWTTQRG